MKRTILVVIVMVTMAYPASAHGFGLLRYFFDGVANQLGLDRGPIPKAIPTRPYQGLDPRGYAPEKHPDSAKIHVQAEGF
ncbi:MAG: hypothetical protein HY913_15485 [Desulfomonile tiedjei]|nr:hypothetical protein [Desulfomonile tiedjei]